MVSCFAVLKVGDKTSFDGGLSEPMRLNTECFPLASPKQTTFDFHWKVQLRPHVTVCKGLHSLAGEYVGKSQKETEIMQTLPFGGETSTFSCWSWRS